MRPFGDEGESLDGATDDEVEHRCREEARVLVTLDLDFADIRRFPPGDGPGILILRPSRLDTQEILKLLKGMLQLLPDESPEGRLWIVESGRIRVRG